MTLRKVFMHESLVVAVSEVGSVDSDVMHPNATSHSFIEDDSVRVEMGYTFDAVSGTYAAPLPPVIDPVPAIKAAIVASTQKRLDDFAKSRNYDSILSACTYATSTVPKFQAEGQYCVDARDATWYALYTLMSEVEQGNTPMPAGFADVEPLLPVLTWPV